MPIARLVDDSEWDYAIDIGTGLRLLHSPGTKRYLIEHTCRTIDEFTLVVAPGLSGEHNVFRHDESRQLTITPSILCPDCGLHGYVVESKWMPV